MNSPPDWQLPPGVNRPLWDYLHDSSVARGYDDGLADSPLFETDLAYVERFCPGPSRLIDLGCGTGRLLRRLAQRGWNVVGVDLSAEMIAIARHRTLDCLDRVTLLQANLVELDGLVDASFDHAACLFSTLGMIVGEAARRRFLEHVHRILRPGGTFILHVHNRWWSLRDSVGRAWLLADWWKQSGDRIMPPQRGVGMLTMHLFTRSEATALLCQAGFTVVDVTPLGLGADSRLRWPRWFSSWRAYGFLLAARKA